MEKLPKSPFPPGLAPFLDNPIRRLLINRERFLRGMGVKGGQSVLEVGCGPGFFTETLSRIVGQQGKVYAQDVEEAMIRRVKKKLPSLPFTNVTLLLCASTALELPGLSFDVVLCLNVLEEIYKEGGLTGTVKEIDRVLKTGGAVVIKEHRFGNTAPIVREAEGLFEKNGYEKVSEKRGLLSYQSRLLKR